MGTPSNVLFCLKNTLQRKGFPFTITLNGELQAMFTFAKTERVIFLCLAEK